jgi:transcriptional regulator with XRE-family HTH domain
MPPAKQPKKRAKKKRPAAPTASRGLDAHRLASAAPPTAVETLGRTVEDDGGSVLATYRDPLGSHWQLLVALPMEARGKLLLEIREHLGLSQFEMAARLNEQAMALRLPQSYRDYTVSRNESGTISFEDAAVWLALDPARAIHGWEWFIFVPATLLETPFRLDVEEPEPEPPAPRAAAVGEARRAPARSGAAPAKRRRRPSGGR